jgi:carbon storage regulator CsrA
MLVLTRKTDQRIQIGENITITVIRVKGQSVRIGIEAPQQIRVMRTELTQGEHKQSSGLPSVASDSLPSTRSTSEGNGDSSEPAIATLAQEKDSQEGPRCRPLASRLCRTPGASRATVIRRPQRLGPACLRSMAGRF